MRWRAVAWVVGSTIVAVATLLGVLIATFDINDYRDTIAAAIEDQTGRKVTIEGRARLALSMVPTFAVENVTIANAPWGTRREMLRLRRLEAVVELRPLLDGTIRIRRLRLVRPDFMLETNQAGHGNWMVGATEPTRTRSAELAVLPTIQRITIRDATIAYRDGRSGDMTVVKLARLEARADSLAAPIAIDTAGSFRDIGFALTGFLGSVATLLDGDARWPVSVAGTVANSAVSFQGDVGRLLTGPQIAGKIAVSGNDLAQLGAAMAIRLPSGRFVLDAAIRHEPARIEFGSLQVKWRESDLAGTVKIEPEHAPVRVSADLVSTSLDLDSILKAVRELGVSEIPPKSTPERPSRLIPDIPFEFDWARSADVEVKLSLGRLIAKGLEFKDVAAEVWSQGGVVELKQLTGSGLGGTVAASLQVDTTGAVPKLWAGLWLTKVDVDRVVREIGGEGVFRGKGDVWAVLQGSGASLHPVLADLGGYAAMQIGQGVIDHAHLPPDLARKLDRWVSGSTTKLHCLVVHQDVAAGVVTSRSLLFDSERVTAIGDGGGRLAQETFDYDIALWPKLGMSVDPEAHVKLQGTYAEPKFEVNTFAAIGSGIGSLFANLVLLPVGAMMSMFKGPTSDDEKCIAAAATAEELRRDRPTAPPLRQGLDEVGGAAKRAIEETGGAATRILEGVGRGIERGLRNLFGR